MKGEGNEDSGGSGKRKETGKEEDEDLERGGKRVGGSTWDEGGNR